MELKPCPCGKVPTKLHLFRGDGKWAYASGDCCDSWYIEFRTNYYDVASSPVVALAENAWNNEKRGTDGTQQI